MLLAFSPIAVTALLSCPPTEPAQDDQRGTIALHPEQIELAGGRSVTVERGTLFAPLVRSDSESAVVEVEVYRFPAAEDVPAGTPPVFLLHGGPGWPGYGDDLARRGYYERAILPHTRVAELVVVGQRGIGSSKPNTVCEGPPEPPAGVDPTREQEAAAIAQACADCRSHWESQGYDLRGFNVIEAAADVDDIRRLLGYDKITIWGGSFGSHWGMALMRYYPDSVARALLTGMEGSDQTYDMPSGVLASLERLAGDAELDDGLIAHVPDVGLIGALEATIKRCAQEPVVVEVRHPRTGATETVRFDADDVRDLALGYTGHVSSRRGAVSWPADIIALYNGDFERAAQARLGDGGGGLPTASFFMLDCGSGISPARLEKLENDPAAAIVGNLGRFYQQTCPSWGADLGEDFRAGFKTKIPTVIVHGTWDTSTPFDNALELLPSFEDLHFVVVDGGSHGALGEARDFSPEFRAAIDAFVATGDRSGLPDEVRMPALAFAPPYRSR